MDAYTFYVFLTYTLESLVNIISFVSDQDDLNQDFQYTVISLFKITASDSYQSEQACGGPLLEERGTASTVYIHFVQH